MSTSTNYWSSPTTHVVNGTSYNATTPSQLARGATAVANQTRLGFSAPSSSPSGGYTPRTMPSTSSSNNSRSIGSAYAAPTPSYSNSGGAITGLSSNSVSPDVLKQMQANSEAWYNASPAEQARLQQVNQQLGASAGLTFDSKTGQWTSGGQTAFTPRDWQTQQTDNLNNIYDQQEQASLAALKTARETAVNGYNQQKADLLPQYANLRNQADVTNAQDVNKLREIMANQGLMQSGDFNTATMGLGLARQNTLAGLNTQQQSETNTINNQVSVLNNSNDEAAITSQIEAQRSQSLADLLNKSHDYGLQQQQNQETTRHNQATETAAEAANTDKNFLGRLKALNAAGYTYDAGGNIVQTAQATHYANQDTNATNKTNIYGQSVDQTGAYQQGKLSLAQQSLSWQQEKTRITNQAKVAATQVKQGNVSGENLSNAQSINNLASIMDYLGGMDSTSAWNYFNSHKNALQTKLAITKSTGKTDLSRFNYLMNQLQSNVKSSKKSSTSSLVNQIMGK